MTAGRRLQQIQRATLLLVAFLFVVPAQEQVQLIPLSWQTDDYEVRTVLLIGCWLQRKPCTCVHDENSFNLHNIAHNVEVRSHKTPLRHGALTVGELAAPPLPHGNCCQFYARLGIGTPAQPFRLVIDTGSANLWVPGSQCSSLECTQRAQYNPQQSSTSQVLGKQVPISYGAGQVNSVLVQDVVSLPASGSSSSSSGFIPGLTFTQTLGMAVQMNVGNSSSNTQQPWDGIMVSAAE